MRGKTNLGRKIAMLLCAVLVLPSFITIFSCFSDMTKVNAATDTSKGELPVENPETKPDKKPSESSVLLPDLKLPTMEVGVLSTPAYVRLKENREFLSSKEYRVESSNESICVAENVQQSKYDDAKYWSVKGLKKGTAKLTIYDIANGDEKKIATYRVNVMPELTQKTVDAGLDEIVQAFAVDSDNHLKDSYTVVEGAIFGIWNLYDNVKSEAEYELKPDNSDVLGQGYAGQLNALKPGKANVTVVEKIAGTEKVIGKVPVTVEKLKLELLSDKVTVNYLESQAEGCLLIKDLVRTNADYDVIYNYTTSDTDVIKDAKDIRRLTVLKEGTADITVFTEINEKEINLGTMELTIANTMTKGETITIEPEYLPDGRYKSKVNISTCIVNPIQSSYAKAEYLALQKDSDILHRGDFKINPSKMPKNGAYLIFEDYKGLIVPVGEVKIKFVGSSSSATSDEPEEPDVTDEFAESDYPVIGTDVNNPVLMWKTLTLGLYDQPEYIASFISPFDFSGKVKYSYKVKDTKIVKVENDCVMPLKKGKTTIAIKAKVDGKTKNVGTLTVTVADKTVQLRGGGKALMFEVPMVIKTMPLQSFIQFYHPKATYSCKVSSKSVVYDAKKQVFTLKKAGTVKITITEKYNGKTTKLGTVTLKVTK